MKAAILVSLAAGLLVAGCAQTPMTRVEYRDIKLEIGGRVVPVDEVAVADFQPGVYYSLDVPVRQVVIEAKIVEVSRGRQLRDIGIWWPGQGQGPMPPSNVVDTTPRPKPVNLSFGVGTTIGGGQSNGGGGATNHPPGCTCEQCRGGGSAGGGGILGPPTVGVGAGVPVGGNESPAVTAVRSIFDLHAGSAPLSEAFIFILLETGRDLSGRIIARPMLLPIQTVGDPNAPELKGRQAATVVSVGDGDTVVLGGLFNNDPEEAESKIPALGDIPLLGRLFRKTDDKSRKTELLIFVTPRVILTEEP